MYSGRPEIKLAFLLTYDQWLLCIETLKRMENLAVRSLNLRFNQINQATANGRPKTNKNPLRPVSACSQRNQMHCILFRLGDYEMKSLFAPLIIWLESGGAHEFYECSLLESTMCA